MPIRRKSKSKTSEDQIINRGEYHIPVAVVLDVSWKDEEDYKQVVSQAVIEFLDAAKENSFASGRLDICLIACNNRGQILNPFCSPVFLDIPTMDSLDQKGECSIDAAVQKAVEQIEQVIFLYKNLGISRYYSPVLFIFSRKKKRTLSNTTTELIKREQARRNLLHFLVPLNDYAGTSALAELQSNTAGQSIVSPSFRTFQKVFSQLAFSHSVQFSASKRTDSKEYLSSDKHAVHTEIPPAPSNIEIGI